jgi:hypothetical protein
MYAYIMSKISKESLDEISRDKAFKQLELDRDPLDLWLMLKKMHMVSTVSKVETVIKKTARDDYRKCTQGEFESIVDYKRRFDARLETYKASGNQPLDDKDIAMDFMYGLDNSRYAKFKAEIVNDIAKDIMKEPDDLNVIYVLASRRVVVKKNQTTIAGSTFVTTLADNTGNKKNGRNRGRQNNNNNKSEEKKADDNNKNNNQAQSSNENQTDEKKRKQEERMKNATCFTCGEKGHYARDCKSEEDATPMSGMTLGVEDTMACFATAMEHIARMFKLYEVCLDNGSQVNIVHPLLLTNL